MQWKQCKIQRRWWFVWVWIEWVVGIHTEMGRTLFPGPCKHGPRLKRLISRNHLEPRHNVFFHVHDDNGKTVVIRRSIKFIELFSLKDPIHYLRSIKMRKIEFDVAHLKRLNRWSWGRFVRRVLRHMKGAKLIFNPFKSNLIQWQDCIYSLWRRSESSRNFCNVLCISAMEFSILFMCVFSAIEELNESTKCYKPIKQYTHNLVMQLKMVLTVQSKWSSKEIVILLMGNG